MDDTLRFVLIAVGAAGLFTGGFMTGSVFAHKKLEEELEERLEKALAAESDKIKSHYAAIHKTEFSTPEALNKKRAEEAELPQPVQALAELYSGGSPALLERGPQPGAQYLNINPKPATIDEAAEEEQAGIVIRSVFNNKVVESDSWDPDTTQPHVITVEQFNENGTEWDQTTLTWFAGDNTLCDEKDAPVEDMRMTVGDPGNLELFGFISKDQNVVHIRNPLLEAEYEIVRSPGTYREEVAGFKADD